MVRAPVTTTTTSHLDSSLIEHVKTALNQPLRILHVDDTEGVLKLQQLYLQRHTEMVFDYIGVMDSATALRTIVSWRPDLILSDIARPCMDGYTFTELLKSRPDTSAIPVAILTAKANPSDKQRALAAGASVFITKPGFQHLGKIHQLAAHHRVEKVLEPIAIHQQLAISRTIFALPDLDTVIRAELKRRLMARV
jgi:CheY-like chemotaxis protein